MNLNLRNLFARADDMQEFAPGAVIFSEGDPGEVMFVVVDGEVELSVRGAVVGTVGVGDIVGEMALIDAAPRSAKAVAKTACRLAPVNERRFLFMVQATPNFALHVMRVLVNRLRRMNTAVQSP